VAEPRTVDLARLLAGRVLCMHRPALDSLLQGAPLAMLEGQRDRAARGYYVAESVAVIPVMGTLLKRGTGDDWLDGVFGIVDVEQLLETFRTALADDAAESILLQIDSPGGEARGVFDVADAIYAARGAKPIVAIADEWAFSAGYLLASAADRVVVPRTGGVGSIGVYTVRLDVSALDAAAGVRWAIIEYGARKADGNPHKPISDEEVDDLREQVARIGDLFVETVARNRGLSATRVRALEARALDAELGLAAGLVDAVATFGDAILDMATAPRVAGAVKRKGGNRMDTPKGGEVISLDEHRAQLDAARAEGVAQAAAERERVATITDMCAAAGRLDLLASFISDPACAVPRVAKALADAKVAASAAEVQGQRVTAAMVPTSYATADEIYARRRAQMQGRA
jgi:capsid assembly protease